MRKSFLILSMLLMLAACQDGPTVEKSAHLSPNDWLLGAKDDAARFKSIQQQLRGFDQPMWEVGERYTRMHDALKRQNPELAVYQWDKIKTTIENGIAKRPARRENAEQLFLGAVWEDVSAELKANDAARAWQGFERAKAACQACHIAEGVTFLNDQAVFDLAAPTGSATR